MKKTITLLLLLVISSIAMAQIDIAVTSIDKPEFIKDSESTTDLDIQFTIKNNGDALSAGDTLLFRWLILAKADFSTLVVSNPALILVSEDLPTGQSFQTPVVSAGITGTLGATTEIIFLTQAFLFNRSTSPVDADSTDNSLAIELLWEKNYGVSVPNVEYNNNIAAYPNPASSTLNVALLFAARNAVSIELIDLSGKTVLQNEAVQSITPNNYQLNVGGLERGIYILKVANGDKVSTTKVTISQ